jgi:predicted XRE-type DNA-binding protein
MRDYWRRREMPRSGSKSPYVSRGNVFEDLGFSPEEAAILRMKTQLHIEIMRTIEKKGLMARQLERALDVPQPRGSELFNGKISRMTADLLAKYLYRLGREVEMKTKMSRRRSGVIA